MESITNFITLNCNGFKSNSLYIANLCKNHDCLFLTETWLLETEKHFTQDYKNDFFIIFTAAKRHNHGRPFGGNLLLLRKNQFTKPTIILQEDFSTSIVTKFNNKAILISGLYLQSLSSSIESSVDTYQSQLSTVSGVIERFSSSAIPFVLGDFQCFPDSFKFSNRAANTNSLSKYLSAFLTNHNLIPVDITHGKGPNYTYKHISMPNKSYIDHILIQPEVMDIFLTSNVLNPNPINTSDHLPVSLQLKQDVILPCSITTSSTINHETPTFHENPDNIDGITQHVPNYMWNRINYF